MEHLSALLGPLPERHRSALTWFSNQAGKEQSWLKPLADGTLLASKAKGIYKPSWSRYALSIRQSFHSPYPDKEPVVRANGTWSYFYFQENTTPEARDVEYTNRGLIECWRDKVPVGVIRQVNEKPSRYKILGLALVAGWTEGYFVFEGFAPDSRSYGRGSAAQVRELLLRQEIDSLEGRELDSLVDCREKILALISQRRGQPEFRRELLDAYERRCAMTGCDAIDALEAAHILPYNGPGSNHVSNGLLLRADVHALFDLGLISVDTATMTLLLAPDLAKTSYGGLSGNQLRLPSQKSCMPNKHALDQHKAWSRL
jgi:hypothetical protein